MPQNKLTYIITLALFWFTNQAFSQCPIFFDDTQEYVSNPLWKNCTAGDYTLNIVSDINTGPYTINWGDGNTENGPGFVAGVGVTHFYPASVANYNITITVDGCTINGLLVSEFPVKASIEVAPGGVIQVCAPGDMEFLNNSQGASSNTTYQWNFGDGTGWFDYDDSNTGQVVAHTYQRGTVTCNTRVTLRAQNFCTTQPSEATFEPVQIWDLDEPAIGVSNALLCWPDNEVTYTNNTYRNCNRPNEGNTAQRFEYWRFIDYFGPGQDSIIDWKPWPPSSPKTISYPGVGTYSVELRARNFCGEVSVTRTIEIIDAPIAAVGVSKDTICLGEDVVISDLSTGQYNKRRLNQDDGNGFRNWNGNDRTVSYTTVGTKTIKLAIDVNNGSESCKDTAEVQVVVLPDPVPDFEMSDSIACGALNVNFTNNTVDADTYFWDFGNGQTSNSQNPGVVNYGNVGDYEVALTVSSSKGCESTIKDSVFVLEVPDIDFTVDNACVNSEVQFNNETDIHERNEPITWSWTFGDGNSSTEKDPNHLYLTAGTKVVRLTVNGKYCDGAKSKSVSIFNKPDAKYSFNPAIACAPVDITFNNQSARASAFKWYAGNTVFSQDINPVQTFNNSGSTDSIITIALLAISPDGCTDSIVNDLVLHPEVTADFDFSTSNNCSDYEVNFQNNSQGGDFYNWDFGDGNTSIEENPSHNYVNQSAFDTEVDVTLIVESNEGCIDEITKTISIAPESDIDFTASPDSGCSPLNVFFTAEAGAAVYDWEFPDGTTASSTAVTKTFTNNTAVEKKFQVKLTTQSSNGCVSTTSKTIVVHPDPEARFDLSPKQGCSPLEVTFTNNSLRNTSSFWEMGNTTKFDTNRRVFTHTFGNTSGSEVKYFPKLIAVSKFGCTDTLSDEVTVFSGFDVDLDIGDGGCSPHNQVFEASGAISYEWQFGNGLSSNQAKDSTVYFNDNTNNQVDTFQVRLVAEAATGCRDTVYANVPVFPKPVANFSFVSNDFCAPLDVEIINESVNGDNFFWEINNKTFKENATQFTYPVTNNASQEADVYIKLRATNVYSCQDTTRKTITVKPEVIANYVHDTASCSPFAVKFFNLSENADEYEWDFGVFGFSNAESPDNVFVNEDPDTLFVPIKLIAKSNAGCTDTLPSVLYIFPQPIADFNSNLLKACSPFNAEFSDLSQGADDVFWDLGDGTFTNFGGQNPIQKTYTNQNTFQKVVRIRQRVENNSGCSDESFRDITIYPNVYAFFDSIPSDCEPLQVNLANKSQNFSEIEWNINGTEKVQSNQLEREFISNSGGAEVQFLELVAENADGCTDTIRREFTVFPTAQANFNKSADEGCEPLEIFFSNNSIKADNVQWDFGTGNLENDQPGGIIKSFENPNSFETEIDITLYATNSFGCNSEETQTILLYPRVEAIFTSPENSCAPLNLVMTHSSTGSQNVEWNFSDMAQFSSQSAQYEYDNSALTDRTEFVELVAFNSFGCSDTLRHNFEVWARPNVNFFILPDDEIRFPDRRVEFLNNTNGNFDHTWKYGDGTQSTNPQGVNEKSYTTWGEYEVTLISFSTHCIDSLTQVLTILPPIPNPGFIGGGEDCAPASFAFVDTTSYAVAWQWDFGDDESSSQENPIHTFENPGTYDVSLTVTGPGGDQRSVKKSAVVIALPSAEARFYYSPDIVRSGNEPVDFINLSSGANSYYWEFGDGLSSTEVEPTHIFSEDGVYDIMLVANNTFDCPDTMIISNAIEVISGGTINLPNAFTPNQDGSRGGAYNPSAVDNDIFFPVYSEVDNYLLQIFNRWGELIFESQDVKIGWDGYIDGKLAQQDVYVYKVSGTYLNNSSFEKVGEVTLLR